MADYTIKSGNIVITTKFPREHINEFVSCANDSSLGLNLMSHGFHYPYTEEDAMEFIYKNREVEGESFAIDFYIIYENNVAGVIGLSDIDYDNSRSHVGYWIGKDYRGKGIATEALKAVIYFAARTLRLHSLYTSALIDNIGSIIVLTRNGFSIDGISKDCFMYDNRFYSAFMFSQLL